MADDVVAYEDNPVANAIGRGTIYTVLGIVVLAGLVLTIVLGLTNSIQPNLLTPEQAFAMGGLAIVVVSVAMLVMLFSLTGTIRYMQREMQDLTRLRQSIETSYSRLAGATQNLGHEVGELRQILPTLRKIAAGAQAKAERANQ